MQLSGLKNFVLTKSFIVTPQNKDGKNYCFITFPENDSFLEYYSLLNIKPSYCRYVYVPFTQKPMTKLTSDYRQQLMGLELKAISGKPGEYFDLEGKNFYLDLTNYINSAINTFDIKDFKSGRGIMLVEKVMSMINEVPEDTFERVLLYTTNISKPFEKNIMKKRFFGILKRFLKGEDLPFDKLILFFYDSTGGRFIKLYDKMEKRVNAAKIKQVLTKLKMAEETEEELLPEEDTTDKYRILSPSEKIEKTLFGNVE